MRNTIDIDGGHRPAIMLAAIVVFSVFSVAIVAAAGPSDDLDYEADNPAPNPYVSTDLTVAEHPMSEGTSADAMAGYYDDSGDWVSDPVFVVNTTEDVSVQSTMNKYTYDPVTVIDSDRGEFPETNDESGDNDASILDASEWTEDESGTAGSGAIADTTVSGATAVAISTSGQTDTDTYDIGYGNWTSSFDSDESKRVLQVGASINSMDAGARVDIELHDESGDVKEVRIEPDASGVDTNATVAHASASGNFYYQIKLNALPTTGGGSWDNIESANVTVHDANADVSITQLSFVKKSKVELGKRAVDNADDDTDFDQRNSTYNATGTISVHDLGTLDAAFDDATLTDVQFPAKFRAQDLQGSEGEEGVYQFSFENSSSYPSYDKILNATYRLRLPGAIDLSYSTNDLKMDQEYPDDRFLELGHELNVNDNDNLSQASLTDDTGDLSSSVGDTVKLVDSGINSGEYMIVDMEVLLTQPEVDDIIGGTASDGGGAPPAGGSGGGSIVDFLMSPLGILSSLGAVLLSGRWAGWF